MVAPKGLGTTSHPFSALHPMPPKKSSKNKAQNGLTEEQQALIKKEFEKFSQWDPAYLGKIIALNHSQNAGKKDQKPLSAEEIQKKIYSSIGAGTAGALALVSEIVKNLSKEGIEAASNAGQAATAPQEGETPVTDGASSASGEQAVEGAADPKAANGETNTETQKPETEKKETNASPKQEEGGIMKGWIKTKVGLGAALLAGGIALKMTLIGIIPGLIMAGAGAALMGWGSINYFMKDK